MPAKKTTQTKTKPKLDIKAVLKALDLKDRDYYNRLEPEQRKMLNFWMLQRYMSSSTRMEMYHLYVVNEFCNLGFVSDTGISKHPELQWISLCGAGSGQTQYHPFVKPPNAKKKRNKLLEFVCEQHPEWKTSDAELFININSKQHIQEWMEQHGLDHKEIQEIFGQV